MMLLLAKIIKISRLYDYVQVKLRASLMNVTTFLTYSDVQTYYKILQS